MRLKLPLSAALVFFCLGGASVSAQEIDPGEAGYIPAVDEHRFGLQEDRIISKPDRRLLLLQPYDEGTLEFHLTRSWADNTSPDTLFCIAYVGGKRKDELDPSVAGAADKAADPPAADTGIIDPYDELDQIPGGGGRAATRDLGEPAGEWRFWPRFAIYINNTSLFLQSGDRLLRSALSKRVVDRLANRNRIHFVISFRPERVLVHADGLLCAQFKRPQLVVPEGIEDLAGHTLDQLVLGTVPEGELGTLQLFAEVNGQLELEASGYDLGKWLQHFDGKLGGVRFWARAFAEDYVSDPRGQPRIAMRGAHDVANSIAFPDAKELSQPSYVDLVCFSDFLSPNAERHHMQAQFPLSGNWVNSGLSPRVVATPPPGLKDTYGNVDDLQLITIVGTGSPADWLVYQNADLIGFLHMQPGLEEGAFSQSLDKDAVKVPVRLKKDLLEFTLAHPGLLFGGDLYQPAKLITLRRPRLKWLGEPVSKDNPFWTPSMISYFEVPFRAFDITKMDPMRAYQKGYTGSARMIFDEPAKHEFRYDQKTVVPFSHFLCSANTSHGTTDTSLVSTDEEFAQSFAGHVGVWADTSNVSFSVDVRARYASQAGNFKESSLAITKSIAKDFALVLNRSQLRLDPEFREAVHELAAKMRRGDRGPACRIFIETWGTHFAVGTMFGGMLMQTRTMSNSEIRRKTEMGIGIEGEVSGGVRSGPAADLIGKQEVGAKFGFQYDQTKSRREARKKEKVTYTLIPGGNQILNPDQPVSVTISEPAPLFFDLRPLSELLTPANFRDPYYYHDLRDRLRGEIRAYVRQNRAKVKPGQGLKEWEIERDETAAQITLSEIAVPKNFRGRLAYCDDMAFREYKVKAAADTAWLAKWAIAAKKGDGPKLAKQMMRTIKWSKPLPWYSRKRLDEQWRERDKKRGRFSVYVEGEIFADGRWFPVKTRLTAKGGATSFDANHFPAHGRPPKSHRRRWNLRWKSGTPRIYSVGVRPEGQRKGFGGIPLPGFTAKGRPQFPPAPRFEATVLLRQYKTREKKSPPDWSAKRLAEYRKHVEGLAKSYQRQDPRANAVVRRVGGKREILTQDVRGSRRAKLGDSWQRLRLVPAEEADELRSIYQALIDAPRGHYFAKELSKRFLRDLERGLPAGSFFLGSEQGYLGLDVFSIRGGRSLTDDFQRADVAFGQDQVFVPLPLSLVGRRLVCAAPEFFCVLDMDEKSKILHWLREGEGVEFEVLKHGKRVSGN